MLNKLEEINGIGKILLNRLRHKGIDTLEKIISMNIDELEKIPGIGKATALKLKKFAIDTLKENKFIDKKSEFKNTLKIVKPIVPKKSEEKTPIKLEKPVIPINKNLIEIKITPKAISPQLTKTEETLNNLMKNQISKFPIKKQTVELPKEKEKIKLHNRNQKNELPRKKKTKKLLKKNHETKTPLKTFFPHDIMQKIRFLHHKIKYLEDILNRGNEPIKLDNLDYILDYVKILNVNYKTQSHVRIFKELEFISSFHDPLINKKIEIWDLMFECAWALWILARIYAEFSHKYESIKDYKNALVSMVEASKYYKTAAYFSAACTRQEDLGKSLSCDNLELESEEARILAQSLAAEKEEKDGNYILASKIYSGLSALSKRFLYLKKHEKIKEHSITAQYHYDYGMAYFLKAKMLDLGSYSDEEEKTAFRQKSNYYFFKAEEIWQDMRHNFEDLSLRELKKIDHNLLIVNDYIIENDAEILPNKELDNIPEIEPIIAIPENVAPFLPRTTNYLTKFGPKHIEFSNYRKFKNIKIEHHSKSNEMERLKNKKAAIKQTIKELKMLYKKSDIDVNKFSELLEKYIFELKTIENNLKKIKENYQNTNQGKEPVRSVRLIN
ncbi:MAG: helix-hairpin-helix domain-containing protein [Promethearchaeota archaeon]